ncbi:MAG: hypothetical protein ACKVZ0_16055 [Gemmatimonadales bacterium]
MRYPPSLLLATLFAAACDPGTSITDAPRPSFSSNRPIFTGSGHTDLPVSGDMRNFTFHAVTHPNGTVSGSYRLARHDIDAWFRVDVTCMSVQGNTAWVGGIIAETNVPNLIRVGTVSYFFATDNGEGAGSPPDRLSRARTNDAPGQDQAFCALQPTAIFDPNPLTVVQGNVQLR